MVKLISKKQTNTKGAVLLSNLVTPLFNIFTQFLCGILLLFNLGGTTTMPETTLIEQLFACDEIVVYKNGEEIKLDKALVEPELKKLTDKSYFSPAFGVSLHDQTTNAMQKGYWIEFRYNTQRVYADMPFSKLLIELKPDYYGFNLIRFNSGKYDGRCYYLNLNVSSTEFYKFITSVA